MELVFLTLAWEDYLYWQQQDKKMLARINELIKDILRSPFKGIGKPEDLRGDLSGCWSRRINDEHRLVYAIRDSRLYILQCRYHYSR
jgi:toxin YoeB